MSKGCICVGMLFCLKHSLQEPRMGMDLTRGLVNCLA
jgi:hypothetical protein